MYSRLPLKSDHSSSNYHDRQLLTLYSYRDNIRIVFSIQQEQSPPGRNLFFVTIHTMKGDAKDIV